MKKFFALLKSVAVDKWAHLLAGAFVVALVVLVATAMFGWASWPLLIAVLIGIIVSYFFASAKEKSDSETGGAYDKEDIKATAFGSLIAGVATFVIYLVFHLIL